MQMQRSGPAKLLIVSPDVDPHADAVQWALSEAGLDSHRWDTADFPRKDAISFLPDSTVEVRCGNELIAQGPYDSIWVRRPQEPQQHSECHRDDVEVVLRESRQYMHNILPFLAHQGTRWINSPASQWAAESKLFQLSVAERVGFRVPRTYAGNDPARIRQLSDSAPAGIIYKAFKSGYWVNPDGGMTVLRTSLLTAEDLADDYAISTCPGIYQWHIDKQAELRVTVIGSTVIPVLIDSQQHGLNVDWRYDTENRSELYKPYDAPPDFIRKCERICALLQLNYAALDFIIDPRGDYVFLEANPAGQFLFIEHYIPQTQILKVFCEYFSQTSLAHCLKVPTLEAYFKSANYDQLKEREHQYRCAEATKKASALKVPEGTCQ